MWIERLEISGFGRLRGSYELDRGLTVVQGSNEAGKSTLHDALIRAMFGFDSRERRRSQGSSAMLRRAPWQDGPFGLVAIAHRAGRELRIEWAFERGTGQGLVLRDGATGEDLTTEVMSSGGDYALGEWLFGIGLQEYRQWSCLDQAAGGKVDGDRGLVERLRSASETGSEEGGVDRAQELIGQARRSDAIGARAGSHAPLKRGAYRTSTERREELVEWIAGAEAVQADLEAEAQELERLEAEEAELGRRIAGLEGERLLARRAGLRKTLDDASKAERLAAAGVAEEAPEVPREEAERARLSQGLIEELQTERAKMQSRRDAAAGELARVTAEAGPVDAEIRSLAAYESVDASREGQVSGLLGALGERERAVAAADARSGPGGPAGAEAGGGDSVTGGSQSRPRSEAAPGNPGEGSGGRDAASLSSGQSSAWMLPGAVAVASVAGGALVTPALFAGLLIAAAAYLWLRGRRRGDGERRAELAARERAQEDLARAEREAGERARAEARARLAELQDELAVALDEAGAAPGEPRERARSYLESCRRAERLAALRSERRELDARIRALQEPAGQLRRIESELAERGAQLEGSLRALGIDAEGAEAIAELERRESAASAAREQRLAAEQARESLQAILGGRTVAEVEASLREVESELEGHRARHGAFDGAPRAESEISRELDDARAARTGAARALGTARQRVDDLEGRLRDLPARRAELELVEEKIKRIEFAIDALAIAAEQLGEAAREAHRRSVPGLNRAIAAELPRLTEGRYTQATVNEELEITLTAPEVNRAVPADRLSKGTQDQIYLVQRLAILELLGESRSSEPPPLLLDDAFAHFDDPRRRAALELLAEKAARRQIVLFADDPEVAEELEAIGATFKAVELPGPADRVGV